MQGEVCFTEASFVLHPPSSVVPCNALDLVGVVFLEFWNHAPVHAQPVWTLCQLPIMGLEWEQWGGGGCLGLG